MTAQQLKEVRVSLGLTQLQFAQMLGLKRKSTICNYEKGIRKVPGWVGRMLCLCSYENKKKVCGSCKQCKKI